MLNFHSIHSCLASRTFQDRNNSRLFGWASVIQIYTLLILFSEIHLFIPLVIQSAPLLQKALVSTTNFYELPSCAMNSSLKIDTMCHPRINFSLYTNKKSRQIRNSIASPPRAYIVYVAENFWVSSCSIKRSSERRDINVLLYAKLLIKNYADSNKNCTKKYVWPYSE